MEAGGYTKTIDCPLRWHYTLPSYLGAKIVVSRMTTRFPMIPKASSLGSMLKTEDPRLEIYL